MAIVFTCKCKKKLTARDELAGRKMKCSSCGAVVPIPAAKVASAKVASAKVRPLVAVGASEPARALPVAKPVSRPVDDDDPPLARPVRPQLPAPCDTLQGQLATPWARGDKASFAPPPPSEGSTLYTALLLLVLVAAGGGAAWYYLA